MKPQLLKIPKGISDSFSARHEMIPNINNRWHYHAELELIQFHKGHGTQFVGDNIRSFGKGDIVLVGANLPHFWKYETTGTKEKNALLPYATVIHFTENFWGDCFLNLPETASIKSIIKNAQRGILIHEKNNAEIKNAIDNICAAKGVERIIALLKCLSAFAGSRKKIYLSSIGFSYDGVLPGNDKINDVYAYTLKNFKQQIQLKKVASVASLAVNSFCRYFKTKTGKTYIQFLLEIRVGYACKLLIDNRYSIKQICFESGFSNFTSFHKTFKKNTGKTPRQYFTEYSQ
jgi:AraC-like DNA-binding protein